MKGVLILRKKITGENSIEEVAGRIIRDIDFSIIECPYDSDSFVHIVKNIIFITKIKASVFHIMCPTEAYLLPFCKGKKVITYHDMGTIFMSKNRLIQFIKNILFLYPSCLFADRITFVSNQTKNEYLKIVNYKKTERLSVIYNSIDKRLKYIKTTPNNKMTLLQIGCGERKNIEFVIESIKSIEVKLLIVGKLSEMQFQLLKIYSIDYENFIDIDFDQIISLYNRCDCVVFCSKYEGFGLPVIEAQKMKKPVLLSDIPIFHEIAGKDAVFINSREQLKKQITRLKTEKTYYNKVVEDGVKNSERFEAENINQQYKNLYQNLINETSSKNSERNGSIR